MSDRKPRYFEKPDEGEKPLSFWRVVFIVMSAHIGVRPREKREEDFRRANGLHIFIAAIIYFVLILVGLIFFVRSLV